MDLVEEFKSKILTLAECNKEDHWKDEVLDEVEKLEAELRNKLEGGKP